MSHTPRLVMLFPQVPDADQLDLAMGLVGCWGCTLYVLGARVYFADPLDHPDPFERPFEALPGSMGTVLADEYLPTLQMDALCELRLGRSDRGVSGRVRLRYGAGLAQRAEWTFDGGRLATVRAFDRILAGVADHLRLQAPLLGWQDLTMARTAKEAVEQLRTEGAEALCHRLEVGRLGVEAERIGGCLH